MFVVRYDTFLKTDVVDTEYYAYSVSIRTFSIKMAFSLENILFPEAFNATFYHSSETETLFQLWDSIESII